MKHSKGDNGDREENTQAYGWGSDGNVEERVCVCVCMGVYGIRGSTVEGELLTDDPEAVKLKETFLKGEITK